MEDPGDAQTPDKIYDEIKKKKKQPKNVCAAYITTTDPLFHSRLMLQQDLEKKTVEFLCIRFTKGWC